MALKKASSKIDNSPSSPPSEGRSTRRQSLAEAQGVTPSNYVPMSAPLAGLHLLNWHRAATMMQRLILQTGIARRLHTAIRNYVLGEGIDRSAKAMDPRAQPYLKCVEKIFSAFWNDPRNDLDRQLHDWIFDSSAYGEVCLPVIVDPLDGTVVLQNLPALWINEVEVSDLDVATVTRISTAQGKWSENKKYKEGGFMKWDGVKKWMDVIHYDPYRYVQKNGEDVVVEDVDGKHGLLNSEFGKLHGHVFYFRVNRTLGAVRGWGDSYSVMDLMQALDQFLFDSMNRLDLQSAVVWDLEIDGSDKDVKKWQSEPLVTGSKFFAHNKKIKLTPMSPEIKVAEFVDFIRILRELIAGSVGIPEFAMGYGGDTNVATAKEQSPVMYAEFNNRRTLWESWLKFMLRFVLERSNDAGMICDDAGKTKVLTREELDLIEIQVSFKPFGGTDTERIAASFGKLVDALLAAEQAQYLPHGICQEIVLATAALFGVDTEKAAVEEQMFQEGKETVTGQSGQTVSHSAMTATKKPMAEAAKKKRVKRK